MESSHPLLLDKTRCVCRDSVLLQSPVRAEGATGGLQPSSLRDTQIHQPFIILPASSGTGCLSLNMDLTLGCYSLFKMLFLYRMFPTMGCYSCYSQELILEGGEKQGRSPGDKGGGQELSCMGNPGPSQREQAQGQSNPPARGQELPRQPLKRDLTTAMPGDSGAVVIARRSTSMFRYRPNICSL